MKAAHQDWEKRCNVLKEEEKRRAGERWKELRMDEQLAAVRSTRAERAKLFYVINTTYPDLWALGLWGRDPYGWGAFYHLCNDVYRASGNHRFWNTSCAIGSLLLEFMTAKRDLFLAVEREVMEPRLAMEREAKAAHGPCVLKQEEELRTRERWMELGMDEQAHALDRVRKDREWQVERMVRDWHVVYGHTCWAKYCSGDKGWAGPVYMKSWGWENRTSADMSLARGMRELQKNMVGLWDKLAHAKLDCFLAMGRDAMAGDWEARKQRHLEGVARRQRRETAVRAALEMRAAKARTRLSADSLCALATLAPPVAWPRDLL